MFKKIMGWFSGKKVYVACFAVIANELKKIAETGELATVDWKLVWEALTGIFVRQAIAKAAKANGG